MNYNNVLKAIEMITSPEGLGMSKTDHGFYFWCSKMIKNWQMTTSNSNWQFLCTPQLMKSVPESCPLVPISFGGFARILRILVSKSKIS
jgi:hypothetical protein